MQGQLSKTIVMVGLMGAGKTAIGTELARQLGVGFVDTDQAIEKAADRTITEIFARDGEAFFRKKEGQILQRLLEKSPHVMSTGGGAFVSAENRQVIKAGGISVWLDVPLDILWERVSRKATRPLLQVEDPYGTLATLLEDRRPAYAEADIRIALDQEQTVDDTTAMVVDALKDAGVLA